MAQLWRLYGKLSWKFYPNDLVSSVNEVHFLSRKLRILDSILGVFEK